MPVPTNWSAQLAEFVRGWQSQGRPICRVYRSTWSLSMQTPRTEVDRVCGSPATTPRISTQPKRSEFGRFWQVNRLSRAQASSRHVSSR